MKFGKTILCATLAISSAVLLSCSDAFDNATGIGKEVLESVEPGKSDPAVVFKTDTGAVTIDTIYDDTLPSRIDTGTGSAFQPGHFHFSDGRATCGFFVSDEFSIVRIEFDTAFRDTSALDSLTMLYLYLPMIDTTDSAASAAGYVRIAGAGAPRSKSNRVHRIDTSYLQTPAGEISDTSRPGDEDTTSMLIFPLDSLSPVLTHNDSVDSVSFSFLVAPLSQNTTIMHFKKPYLVRRFKNDTSNTEFFRDSVFATRVEFTVFETAQAGDDTLVTSWQAERRIVWKLNLSSFWDAMDAGNGKTFLSIQRALFFPSLHSLSTKSETLPSDTFPVKLFYNLSASPPTPINFAYHGSFTIDKTASVVLDTFDLRDFLLELKQAGTPDTAYLTLWLNEQIFLSGGNTYLHSDWTTMYWRKPTERTLPFSAVFSNPE